jgi:hypothetical protein
MAIAVGVRGWVATTAGTLDVVAAPGVVADGVDAEHPTTVLANAASTASRIDALRLTILRTGR